MGRRYSFFYILGGVSSSFAGILASGLMQLGGQAGIAGWRWIFIIEGILTCVLGFFGYGLLVGFPDDGKTYKGFLTREETKFILSKVDADRGDAEATSFSIVEYLKAAKDLKVWLFAMLFFDTATITYALAYFMPAILKDGLGFTTIQAQCLTAPPYVFAGLNMYLTGWVGDKYHMRGPIIIYNMLLCITGLPIVGWAKGNPVRYFGIFLVTAGSNANIPVM
jgi:MFS family permease